MEKRQAAADVELFARAAALSAAMRTIVRQDAAEPVASEIVRRREEAKLLRPGFDVPEIGQDGIEALCGLLIQPDPADSVRFIANRSAEGLTRQGVFLGHIQGAARSYGDRWKRDEVSFLDVTGSTGYLDALMRALRSEAPGRAAFDSRRVSLFATVPFPPDLNHDGI